MPRPRVARGVKNLIGKTTYEVIDKRNVSDEILVKAAMVHVSMLEKSKSSREPSKLAIAKAIGYTEAPDWLNSPRFAKAVELIKFQNKVLAMQARPEINGLISELIGLGLLEAQKRLVLDPDSIPATVLYGDILHKWPKMLSDFAAGSGPVKTGDVFQTLVLNIESISDPNTRELLKKQIIGRLESAVLALKPADTEVVDAPDSDSPEPVVRESPMVRVGTVDSYVDESEGMGSVSADVRSYEALFDDPALD